MSSIITPRGYRLLIKILILVLILPIILISFPGCKGGGGAARHPIEVKISFSEPPLLGKPVQVTATFNLVNDYFKEVVHGIDVRIGLSEGFQLVDGNLDWRGDFLLGQTYIFQATVKTIK